MQPATIERKRARNGEATTRSLAKSPLGNLPAERREEVCNEVLAKYMDGQQVAAMAKDYGVSDVTIYALLLRERAEDWRDIQQARALARLERAQQEMRDATDMLSLARARELVRSAQFELERLLARFYSAKQELTVTHRHDLADRIQQAEARIIDVTPTEGT